MSAAAAGFPAWVLLEPYVFRRDDDSSFPDESEAPMRASGTTSWGADFRVALSLAEPPRISRLYARLPVPLTPPRCGRRTTPVGILATHRLLSLLPLTTNTSSEGVVQNFFIFRANQSNPSKSSLHALPPCTEPKFDYYYQNGDSLHGPPYGTPRLLNIKSLGLWCRNKDEFVVAELTICIPSHNRAEAFADICMLHGHCTSSSAHHQLAGGRWKSMRVEILSISPRYPFITCHPTNDVLLQLCHWQTDTAIPFLRWLCWIDYHQGILFCDMSILPTPTVSFLPFPLPAPTSTRTCNMLYSGVNVVYRGCELKFVNVEHHDSLACSALKPSNGFTITCYTLILAPGMTWKMDYIVTSDDLGDSNIPDCLQHGTLRFPRVDIDRPHVVHFLSVGFGCAKNKMWVVSIDMSTKTVDSYLYMNGREHLQTADTAFILKKLTSPLPFLPCEFPRFC